MIGPSRFLAFSQHNFYFTISFMYIVQYILLCGKTNTMKLKHNILICKAKKSSWFSLKTKQKNYDVHHSTVDLKKPAEQLSLTIP